MNGIGPLVAAAVAASGCLPVASAEVVAVGAGGYLSDRPEGVAALPEVVFRAASLSGPVPTNQWWSSLLWEPLSQPMFALPLALRCREKGMTVWYPGSAIVSGDRAIVGRGQGEGGDLTVGVEGAGRFARADCAGFSDWFVEAEFVEEGGERPAFRASFGQGSPLVFFEAEKGGLRIEFGGEPEVWSGGAGEDVIAVTVHGSHYGLFLPEGGRWGEVAREPRGGGPVLGAGSGGSHLAVALLPDRHPDTLALFRRYAPNRVAATKAEFVIDGGSVVTDYRYATGAPNGDAGSDQDPDPDPDPGSGTLFALYPHQWKYLEGVDGLTGASYRSVRGEMKLASGTGFRTRVPVQGVLPHLPAEGIGDRARLVGYLEDEASRRQARFRDTYWEGKHLGRLASLAGVARAAGEAELEAGFVGEIKRRLEEWFTAGPGDVRQVFYYDPLWGALVGCPASYGSDRTLNDHHFHYGYFVRAAAAVATADPDWGGKWGPMVNLLVRDIASPDRGDAMFPSLRCFDRFAGHSWAAGGAGFADGNNQESSSEAMNAWYSLVLWGAATGDDALRDTGLYLFNTERTAVEEYWFDTGGTNFPEGFPHRALGIVWGGKGAFETWFSPAVDSIYGINWLPFTPASLYLGRDPDYVAAVHDRVTETREHGGDYGRGWGDLVGLFGALADPGPALDYIDRTPRFRVEPGNSRAFSAHWVETLDRLGRVDSGVTADHPLTAVFRRGDRRTYVAYNPRPGSAGQVVTFSDGARLEVAPGSMAVAEGRVDSEAGR